MSSYDTKYGEGKGWKYGPADAAQVRELVIAPTGLDKTGAIVLEVGCGEGFHADAIRKRGLRVIAVDSSRAGIKNAKAAYQYASSTYLHYDGAELDQLFAPGTFDMLYCRGLSWHHYCLNDAVNASGANPVAATARLVSLVRPGGFFCLQICSDFSGSTIAHSVWDNTLKAYKRFMRRFGKSVHCSDWRGNTLPTINPYGGIIITVQVNGNAARA